MEKKTKILIIILIVIIIISLGATSYFIYDKYFNEENVTSEKKDYKVSDYVRIETSRTSTKDVYFDIKDNVKFSEYFSSYEAKKIFFKNLPVSLIQKFIEKQNSNIYEAENEISEQINDFYNSDEFKVDSFKEFKKEIGKYVLESYVGTTIRNKILYIDSYYSTSLYPFSYGDTNDVGFYKNDFMIDLLNNKLATSSDILERENISEEYFLRIVTDKIVKEMGNGQYMTGAVRDDIFELSKGENIVEITIADFREGMKKLSLDDMEVKFSVRKKHLYANIDVNTIYNKLNANSHTSPDAIPLIEILLKQ